MADALRMAIVGCGSVGADHAIVAARSAELRIVALVGRPERAQAVRETIEREVPGGAAGARQFDTLHRALDETPIDLVSVCTPTGVHTEAATVALQAGAHTVVEKPIDGALDRANALVQLARRQAERGIVTSVVSQRRFDVGAARLRDEVRRGALGRISSVTLSIPWWRPQAYYDSAGWRGTWSLDGGGALMNQGIHSVDQLLWMLGEPVEVFAWTGCLAHERIDVEDTAVAVVKFASGVLGTVHASTAAYPGDEARMTLLGDEGIGVLAGDRAHIRSETGVREFAERLPHLDTAGARVRGLARQYDDVIGAIRSGSEPAVSVADGFRALAVILAVYESARGGRPIRMADFLERARIAP